jgi:SRSO17 transposase
MILPIIKGVKKVINFLKVGFKSKGSFRLVTAYVNGLIALGKKTVNKISQASLEIKHQSALNRVLTESKFEKEKLEKRYLKKIKYLFKNSDVYLLIDDTLIERNGEKVEEAQKHFDHNTSSYIKGHQFFTSILYTPLLQLPIFPELYSKNTDSKIEMAQKLIDKLESASIKLHTVLFDSWYSEQELIRKCIRADARLVCAIKANRNVKLHKKRRWQSLSFISKRIRSQKLTKHTVEETQYEVWSKKVRLTDITDLMQLIISQELDKDGNVKGKAHLISTNLQDSPEDIIQAYKLRWKIETYHRDMKQNLGFATVFFRRREGIIRHAILAAIAYAVLNLFMYRKGITMTIGECCEHLRDESNYNLVKKIVEIEDKPTRLDQFEEVFIKESGKV